MNVETTIAICNSQRSACISVMKSTRMCSLAIAVLIIPVFICEASRSTAPQTQLVRDLFKTYDKKVKPTVGPAEPVNVTFSMNLYQIVEINEPQQYVLISVWIIERWDDRMLWWDPLNYSGTIEVHLPCENVWLPDTTLYNSLVMKDEDSRRLQNVVIRTRPSEQVAHIEMLYPAIYKFSCKLNLEFFPFDIQVCTMVFSSWTFDKTGIDYFAYANSVGTSNYIENEGWHIIKTTMERIEREFECCPIPYSLLEIKLHLRRKPLFYVVNLVIPTSIITLIALVGFFTTSSASGIRDEKVSLGINTLLSMSILMLMVSGQMPTTSTSIPLIHWFYLGMIVIISVGTLASSIVINVHKRGQLGKRLTQPTISIIKCLSFLSMTTVPYHLQIHSKELSDILRTDRFTKSWKGAMRRRTNQPYVFSGVSLVSDKSTDLLIGSAFGNFMRTNEESQIVDVINGESEKNQDDTDAGTKLHSEIFNTRQIATKESTRRRRILFSGDSLRSERLTAIEYEWVATVVERCCFVIFLIFFLFILIGINMYGFIHWWINEG